VTAAAEQHGRDPRRSSLGPDYWLRRCRGFAVEADSGRVGVVVDTLYGADAQPAALEVRAGRLGRRVLLVLVDDVAEIDCDGKIVRLRAPGTVLARG
jgi:hypothetical protein